MSVKVYSQLTVKTVLIRINKDKLVRNFIVESYLFPSKGFKLNYVIYVGLKLSFETNLQVEQCFKYFMYIYLANIFLNILSQSRRLLKLFMRATAKMCTPPLHSDHITITRLTIFLKSQCIYCGRLKTQYIVWQL